MIDHRKHPGNTSGYSLAGMSATIFVICPRQWVGGPNQKMYRKELVDWKKAGFPNGVLKCSEGWLWVLSPNPGCEI